MQTYAIMFLISLAEKYYNFQTTLFISPLLRSQSIPFKFRKSIYFLDQESGFPMQIILLKRLFAAESSSFGRFVAPITKMSPLLGLFIPSINTRNQVFSLLDAQFQFQDLAVSMESISSIKMMEGHTCQAAAKTFLIIFYDYPTNLFKIDEADKAKKVHPDYLARALQIQVLPLPGGPYKSNPLGGALIPVYKSGLNFGRITAYQSKDLAYFNPTMSLKETSSFLTISYQMAGSSQTFFLYCQNRGFRFQLQVLSLGLISCSFLFLNGGVKSRTLLVVAFLQGNPNLVILTWFVYCFCFLAIAIALSSRYLLIFCLTASTLYFDVACSRTCLRRCTILSQQRAAYSQLPSLSKFQALTVSALASLSFYILNLKNRIIICQIWPIKQQSYFTSS